MPYVNVLGLFVRRGSYSSALMAAICYGHMALKPDITYLRTVPDEFDYIDIAAKNLVTSSTLFRDEGMPLYIMTFGLSPEKINCLMVDYKLEDVQCNLIPVEADTMPHHSFSPDQIRHMGAFFDATEMEDFLFHIARKIREDGEDYDPLFDPYIAARLEEADEEANGAVDG